MRLVFIWEQRATCATYSINWLVFITEMKSVYCTVRSVSLNKAVCASSLNGKMFWVKFHNQNTHSDHDDPQKPNLLRTELFWAMTQPVLVISYRRFGTTYRSHLQDSRIQEVKKLLGSYLHSWPLKMGPIVCTETSVGNYHYWLRHSPEERSSRIIRGGSLKST